MGEAGSLNWAQFVLQWLIKFLQFAEFNEFNESSAPFRKNSNALKDSLERIPPFVPSKVTLLSILRRSSVNTMGFSRFCNSAECKTFKTHLVFEKSCVLQMRLSGVLEGISKANRYQYKEIRLNTSSGNYSIDLFMAHVLYDKVTTLHLRSHIFQNNSHNIVTPPVAFVVRLKLKSSTLLDYKSVNWFNIDHDWH